MRGIGVKVDRRQLARLQAKFGRFQNFDKEVDLEMRKAAITAENLAARSFTQKFRQLTGTGRNSITSGRSAKGYFVAAIAKYMPFLEWGTRHKFHKGNLRDMLDLGIPEEYAAQFKAVPLKKATNIEGRPYFFPSVKKAWNIMMDNLNKKLKRLAA